MTDFTEKQTENPKKQIIKTKQKGPQSLTNLGQVFSTSFWNANIFSHLKKLIENNISFISCRMQWRQFVSSYTLRLYLNKSTLSCALFTSTLNALPKSTFKKGT